METVQIYDSGEKVAQAAAELFVARARQAIAASGRFSVALAGGGTPRRAYELLAGPPFRELVDWERCHVFWGDERCVAPTDSRSNARMAREALLEYVPVPEDQIHPIDGAVDPGEGARRYELTLRRFFGDRAPRFDLIFLGLGPDGHTASLFPHTPVLIETGRWVAEVLPEGQALWRVTMTAPLLNQGKTIAFLVLGGEKAPVFARLMAAPPGASPLPSRLIRPQEGELLWLVDREVVRARD